MKLATLAMLVLAGVGAWQLRENGILLWQDRNGPLRIGHGSGAMAINPGGLPQIEDAASVEGEPVVVESARPELISPGLELLGPLAGEAGADGLCVGCQGPWPPPGSSKLRRIANDDVVVTAYRAHAPGIYYSHGIRYRYRRGIRRFDEVDDTELCFFVGPELEGIPCAVGADVGRFEGLAEIGGPADYGSARFDPESFDDRAIYTYRPGGELSFEVTISNLSDEDRRVRSLMLGRPAGSFSDLLEPIPSGPITIPRRGHRQVRIRARYDGCESHSSLGAITYGAIEAGEDDVELSIPIEVRAPEVCP